MVSLLLDYEVRSKLSDAHGLSVFTPYTIFRACGSIKFIYYNIHFKSRIFLYIYFRLLV